MSGTTGQPAAPARGQAEPARGQAAAPRVPQGSAAARRQAAAILEVLAGLRTPTQAAQALGVSLPRYYALELRALQGLVGACEPRPKGRRVTPAAELTQLRRQLAQVQRQCARQQTLLRLAQRAVGLPAPQAPPAGKAQGGKKRRSRRPRARALRVLQRLEPMPEPPAEGAAPNSNSVPSA